MLVIGSLQWASLLQNDPEQFADRIVRFLVESVPEELRGIPLPLVRTMVKVAIERARGHGLVSDEHICGFVSVMFEIAPNFDEEPTLRAVLTEKRLTPAQRWEGLFADEPALRAAWERAAQPGFYDHDAWIARPAARSER